MNYEKIKRVIEEFVNDTELEELKIRLNDFLDLPKDEFKKLVRKYKLIERNSDDAYNYDKYEVSDGTVLELDYHKDGDIYEIIEIILYRNQIQ